MSKTAVLQPPTTPEIKLIEDRLYKFEVIKEPSISGAWTCPDLEIGDVKQGVYRTDYEKDLKTKKYIPVFKNGCDYVSASDVRVIEDITDRN